MIADFGSPVKNTPKQAVPAPGFLLVSIGGTDAPCPAGSGPLRSEAVAHAQSPLPRRRDIAAVRLFQVDVHMGGFAEVQVRAHADFPPAAANVLFIGVAHAILGHGDGRFPVKVVQIGSAGVYVAGLDILAEGEAQPADETVHAVHGTVSHIRR